MAPSRQVSPQQLDLIVQFAEANQAMVLSRTGKGPLGQQKANKSWERLARQLNTIGGGVAKTPISWKRYWHLLKCRTKAKDIRRIHMNTTGATQKITPLSDLEERIVAIIGKGAVEDTSGFRIPYDVSTLHVTLPMETQPIPSHRTLIQSTAPAPKPMPTITIGPGFLNLKIEPEECNELEECEEVKPDISESIAVEPVSYVPEPTSCVPEPTSYVSEPTSNVIPEPRDPLAATGYPRQTPGTAGGSQESRRSSSSRDIRDEDLPDWVYDLEERRITVEERMVDEIAGLGATNRAILGCMQQLVQLLQGHLNSNNK